MTTGAQAVAAAVARLRNCGVADAPRDARLLLAHALQVPRDRVTLTLSEDLSVDAMDRFDRAVEARAARQPLSQIVGSRLFWGRDFRVSSDVLDPRPETETLIAEALLWPAANVLDLGTGSGCILLTLLAEWPDAHGVGTDISPPALAVAAENANRLGLSDRAELRDADWFEGVSGSFDLIVSNPPYVTAAEMDDLQPEVRDWEPEFALTPGGDGLAAYRKILPGAVALLAPAGRILLEIGPEQGLQVLAIGADAGFVEGRVIADLDGRDRVVSFTSPHGKT